MKIRSRATGVVAFVLLLGLCASTAFSQSYRGRVQGLVSDQSRAIIAGATVTLLNVATGVQVSHKTGETGLYLFDLVDPGTYTITVEATGFSKFIQENITVQMRGDVTVDAMLKPGSIQESITVTEAPVSVQFNSSNKRL
jgi:hypothetical protein